MTTSNLIPANNYSPDVTDLWATLYFFRNNWKDGFSLSSSFSTDIQQNSDAGGGEVRRSTLSKPTRSIQLSLLADGIEEVQSLRYLTARICRARFLFPLVSDAAFASEAVEAGGNQIPVYSSAHRRLFVGKRVAVVRERQHAMDPGVEIARIISLSNDLISLDSALQSPLNQNAMVVPLIECLPQRSIRGTVLTDETAELVIEALEAAGEFTLPTMPPVSFPQYEDYPLFDLKWNEDGSSEWGWEQPGHYETSSTSEFQTLYGSRPRSTQRVELLIDTQEQTHRLISFWEQCLGAGRAFWMPSVFRGYKDVVVVSENSFSCRAVGEVGDWVFRPYVSISNADGETQVAKVVSATRELDRDTLILESPHGIANPSRVQEVTLSRMENDAIDENWFAVGKMACQISTIEVLNEKAIGLTIPNQLTEQQEEEVLPSVDVFCYLNEGPVPSSCPQEASAGYLLSGTIYYCCAGNQTPLEIEDVPLHKSTVEACQWSGSVFAPDPCGPESAGNTISFTLRLDTTGSEPLWKLAVFTMSRGTPELVKGVGGTPAGTYINDGTALDDCSAVNFGIQGALTLEVS